MRRITLVAVIVVGLGLIAAAVWWGIGRVKGVPTSAQPASGAQPATRVAPATAGRTLPPLAERIRKILTESRSYGHNEVWVHQAAFVGEGQSGDRRWALAYTGKFGLRGELVLGLSDPSKQPLEHFYLTNISAGEDWPSAKNVQVDISRVRVTISWGAVSSYAPEGTPLEQQKASVYLDQVVQDSDRDGYPDLLEKRLGLNPKNPDGDKDGLPDAIDANPQVAPPKSLTEEQKVADAAVSYAYATWELQGTPIVVKSPYPPQEFHGVPDVVLIKDVPSQPPSRWFPVQYIDFEPPGALAAGVEMEKAGKVMQFSPDAKVARVEIGQVMGGLAGRGRILTLEKQQGQWKVTKVEEDWIS